MLVRLKIWGVAATIALWPLASLAATAFILPNGETQFVDQNGIPYAGGSVYFYIPSTTTPKTTWQDPGETTPNTNPVVLDSAGRALIYGSGSYSELLKDSIGNTIWNQLTNGADATAIESALGFVPLNKAGDTATGELVLNYSPTPSSLNVLSAGFRGAPQNLQPSDYTLVLSDSGKMVCLFSGSNHTYTIPPNASVPFPVGTVILFCNSGDGGTLTIARGAGVRLNLSGDGTNEDRTIPENAIAGIEEIQGDIWIITGTAS